MSVTSRTVEVFVAGAANQGSLDSSGVCHEVAVGPLSPPIVGAFEAVEK
jgi:hypothetical protein